MRINSENSFGCPKNNLNKFKGFIYTVVKDIVTWNENKIEKKSKRSAPRPSEFLLSDW